jgi:hypothetical protein
MYAATWQLVREVISVKLNFIRDCPLPQEIQPTWLIESRSVVCNGWGRPHKMYEVLLFGTLQRMHTSITNQNRDRGCKGVCSMWGPAVNKQNEWVDAGRTVENCTLHASEVKFKLPYKVWHNDEAMCRHDHKQKRVCSLIQCAWNLYQHALCAHMGQMEDQTFITKRTVFKWSHYHPLWWWRLGWSYLVILT